MEFNLLKRFVNGIKHYLNEFLDLIYKRKCLNCNCSINEGFLCKNCLKLVQNLPYFPQGVVNNYPIYSVFYYEGGIRALIHSLKFKHNKACAFYIADLIKEYIDKIKDVNFKNAVIIPISTHKKNYYKRGYDNVLEIAKELGKITDLKVDCNSLKKVKYTIPQYKISAKQRKNNIINSFKLDENFKCDNLIIVLDDIVTTGSTLEVVTSLFKERGFNNLICLTFAKSKKF